MGSSAATLVGSWELIHMQIADRCVQIVTQRKQDALEAKGEGHCGRSLMTKKEVTMTPLCSAGPYRAPNSGWAVGWNEAATTDDGI